MKKKKKEIHFFLDEKQYQKLKLEAKMSSKSLSEIIRDKLEFAETNIEINQRIITQLSEKLNKETYINFQKIITSQNELIYNIAKEVKNIYSNQKILEKAVNITAFYSTYSALFSTLKWQHIDHTGKINWEAVKEKREIWKKRADEIVKNILGKSILSKIENKN